jgi:hypothetical protein
LSKTIGVKCKTALAFQHKIRLAMQRSEPHPMKGQVEVGAAEKVKNPKISLPE